ncbi:hypothetical protein TrVE_jg3584 [Triparma verrucosa]|uniref:Uncharacterized protein n=1 Tax=Triparma verrucosa TaxID=1606542 RepID=A0A9W7F4Z2_9STRA|nr:hypothetical protein TrVE_jg3584 [Triparma verrucosa]
MFADDEDEPGMPLPANSLPVDSNAPGYRPADVSNKSERVQKDLDDILNAALDELEDDDLEDAAGGDGMQKKEKEKKKVDMSDKAKAAERERIDKTMEDENKKNATDAMNKLISDLQNPVYGDALQESLKSLSGTMEGVDTIEDYLDDKFKDVKHNDTTEADRTVNKLLDDLGKAGANFEGMETTQVETMGEDIMSQMMGEFEKMGEKEDYQEVIDGMMRQLLSKELMYDPMKQVCIKYPEWLAEAKSQLTEEEYIRYGTQYQYFQRIVAVYETEPDNYPRLMELMSDIQEYGQPPSEIIKELAPGLEFNEEGMPIMPNMGNSQMPNEGGPGRPMGMPGMPIPSGDAANCSVM